MTRCANCSSHIVDDEYYYYVEDVSPEIISIIEQHKGSVGAKSGLVDHSRGSLYYASGCCCLSLCVFLVALYNSLGGSRVALYSISWDNIDLNDEICQTCFTNATEALSKQDLKDEDKIKTNKKRGRPSRLELESKCKQVQQHKKQPETSSILCVWCKSSLYSKRTHAIPDGSEKKLISEMIYPRLIPPGALACHRCWVYAGTVVKRTGIDKCSNTVIRERSLDNVCVHCLLSLSHRRKHRLPEGPIRYEIATRISPRQIPEGGLVCYACWLIGRRAVERRQRENDESQEYECLPEPETHLCVWCRSSLFKRQSHAIPQGPIRNLIAKRMYPQQIPPGGLICYACVIHLRKMLPNNVEEIDNAEQVEEINANKCVHCLYSLAKRRKHSLPAGPVRDEIASRISPRQEEVVEKIEEESEQQTERNEYLRLSEYRRMHGDSASCVLAECKGRAARAPLAVRCHLLATQRLYLPGSARLCEAHCSPDAVLTPDQRNLSNKFTGEQIADMLFLMKHPQPINADNIKIMDQHLRRIWLGVTWEDFLAKTGFNPSIPARAVAIRLCAMNSGECPEVLASLFQLPREEINEALGNIKCLDLKNEPIVPLKM